MKTKKQLKEYKAKWDRENRVRNKEYKRQYRSEKKILDGQLELQKMMKEGTL